jgi:hypothetical protein
MNTGEEGMNINNDADMEAVKKDCDRCNQELATRWTFEDGRDGDLAGYICTTCYEVWDITGPFTGRRFLDGKEIETVKKALSDD